MSRHHCQVVVKHETHSGFAMFPNVPHQMEEDPLMTSPSFRRTVSWKGQFITSTWKRGLEVRHEKKSSVPVLPVCMVVLVGNWRDWCMYRSALAKTLCIAVYCHWTNLETYWEDPQYGPGSWLRILTYCLPNHRGCWWRSRCWKSHSRLGGIVRIWKRSLSTSFWLVSGEYRWQWRRVKDSVRTQATRQLATKCRLRKIKIKLKSTEGSFFFFFFCMMNG